MAAVSIFLEEFDEAPDNAYLNKIICQWRQAEEESRESCGLPSVETHYPGCFFYQRAAGERKLRSDESKTTRKPLSAADVIFGNEHNPTATRKTIVKEEDTSTPADDSFDWETFIKTAGENRLLMDYDHVTKWFNYFPMLDVKTEYYYRYSGTQTVPPCYGRYVSVARNDS